MEQNAQAILIFGVAAASCIVYSIYQCVSFMRNKDKISYTIATIIDTNTLAPETMKKNNSKWAIVSFRVEGKEYVSSNRIQVPMNASIGDQIKIAYYKDNPRELFTPSLKKSGIFFVIGILCIVLMVYIKYNS
ncbi:hypothetical protein RBU49_09405 [Clostridium sp. MB40-C1]|uniref:DUF3592 domain-containing protein n=1 Tax=Clostridium sp. MB40-C1 TaxID=3070996 RepID=UPI0027E1627B|nr:DUF3592 domain-containing protein [Clostridium sp. MB40-C1]WMJ79108.1 hypothetical protein RBU49_09405 [Clostridium sp. MB40-C1]